MTKIQLNCFLGTESSPVISQKVLNVEIEDQEEKTNKQVQHVGFCGLYDTYIESLMPFFAIFSCLSNLKSAGVERTNGDREDIDSIGLLLAKNQPNQSRPSISPWYEEDMEDGGSREVTSKEA